MKNFYRMKKVLLIISLASISLTSCVSKKKFTQLETKNKEIQELLNTATVKLNVCLTEKDALNKQVDYLKQNNSELISNSKELTVLTAKNSQNLEK